MRLVLSVFCHISASLTLSVLSKVAKSHFHAKAKLGSDYFTESFLSKENKTKMKNIYPQIFHVLTAYFRVELRV